MHRQDYGRVPHVAGITPLHARGVIDLGDLIEPDRDMIAIGNGQVAQVFELGGAAKVADQILARVLIDEAAGRVGPEFGDRLLNLVARDVEESHLRGIERNAILADFPANGDDLGHSGDGEKARPQHPVGEFAGLHRRFRRARQRDQHDLAHDRCHRRHLRDYPLGQLLSHDVETLAHLLAVQVDVGAPIELDVDDGEADAGDRTHPRHTGHAVHGGLDRERDKGLDLLRSQALRLRHQRHGRAIEVREHVDRERTQRQRAVDDEQPGQCQHENPVPQAACDEEVEHAARPLSGSG